MQERLGVQRQAYAADLVTEFEQARRIGDVHQGEATVEFIHSRLEDAGD